MSITGAAVAFLGKRAVPGVEEASPTGYRRTLRLPDGGARIVDLADPDDPAARRILGSDAVAAAADAHLGGDPVLGPLVAARPRLRVPGAVDAHELAVRAVLGQQVSLAAARTLAGRLVAIAGDPLPAADGTLTHVWPRPAAIVEAAGALPMPRARQRAVAAVAAAGDLTVETLLALPGVGPWTAQYFALRALADPDAWMPTDLGVRRAMERMGAGPEDAERWRPFRAYAVAHLWASLTEPRPATVS